MSQRQVPRVHGNDAVRWNPLFLRGRWRSDLHLVGHDVIIRVLSPMRINLTDFFCFRLRRVIIIVQRLGRDRLELVEKSKTD